MVNHVYKDIVTGVVEEFKDQYAGIFPLVVSQGKKNDYLGMTLEFS